MQVQLISVPRIFGKLNSSELKQAQFATSCMSKGRPAIADDGEAQGELLAGIKSSFQAKKFPLLESNAMVYLSFVSC